ncbi:hypothetical protein MJO28_015439 [Puccinia striiformis f. sp. tritici]|uniref:Uncharacterized protein n=1 Tax=Puccinia striiformis f. sp. tritici TaxID=168172 RepID=A0ACC0DU24_9BASI|nr:hypothetical protein Pst134EB_028747 [Puccinia striiformis f. sp. tritici]KAI7937834.1 hypothetical protein MJO29_015149 [Puccinia striiformis f. sp. tritici]KAI7938519.1 hypothetical protein MJO28_015439 [Puccinia striiformis f. sp. tritici]
MRSSTSWTVWLSSCILILSILGTSVVDSKKHKGVCRSAGKGKFKKTKKVMGYYPVYNFKIQSPKQVDYSLYTDVLFFVAEPQTNLTFSFGQNLTIPHAEKLAVEFVDLAKKHNVNPLLSIGGWTGSRHFSELSSTAERRTSFATTMVKYAKKLGFVGIDLDWEYPNGEGIGCNTHSPQDTVNFGLLLKEIRKLWPQAQLTAALGLNGLIGSNGSPADATETAGIAENLDFVNLMAYDVFGAWAPTTGPLAPLYATCAPAGFGQSVETGVEIMVKQGFKVQQIILGLPAYAKRLELVSPELTPMTVNGTKTLLYQKHTDVTPPGGIADDKPGLDVCGNEQKWGGSFLTTELISNGWLSKDQKTGMNGYKRHFDKCSGTPFLTNGKYFITYEDHFTSVSKAKWAQEKHLAGVFFFDTTGPTKSTVSAAARAL